MPRDVRGRAVRSETDKELTRPEGDKENKPEKREDGEFDKILQTQALHHDRLSRIESHLGLSKPADEMKSEEK